MLTAVLAIARVSRRPGYRVRILGYSASHLDHERQCARQAPSRVTASRLLDACSSQCLTASATGEVHGRNQGEQSVDGSGQGHSDDGSGDVRPCEPGTVPAHHAGSFHSVRTSPRLAPRRHRPAAGHCTCRPPERTAWRSSPVHGSNPHAWLWQPPMLGSTSARNRHHPPGRVPAPLLPMRRAVKRQTAFGNRSAPAPPARLVSSLLGAVMSPALRRELERIAKPGARSVNERPAPPWRA